MPCHDFYDTIRDGVENAIKAVAQFLQSCAPKQRCDLRVNEYTA